MRRFAQSIILLSTLLGFAVFPVWGQGKLIQTYLINVPEKPGNQYVVAMFSEMIVDPLAVAAPKAPSASQVSVVTRKAGTTINHKLNVSAVNCVVASCRKLEVVFDPTIPPPPEDTEVEVTFTNIMFASGVQTITGVGQVYSTKTIGKFKEKTKQQQKDAAAKVKTTEEKNIFAGFSAAAPSGGSAEGNGELNLNQWVSPDFFVSLNTKKSSADKADPKQFNIGITYRKVFLLAGKAMRDVDQAVSTFTTSPSPENEAAAQTALDSVHGRTLLGFFIDATGRIEGEALNFNVTNAVFDLPLQLSSRTKNIGANSYFNFRLLGGPELGRNLRSDNNAMQKYYIGRFKFGGELSFVYAPEDQENAFPKRVELNLQAVDRYLWRKETAFDLTTNKASGISKGHKPWYQMDLRVYMGESSQGRFGFRVSRIRGTLPPTFSDTRAYTFGAIFESAEDKSKSAEDKTNK